MPEDTTKASRPSNNSCRRFGPDEVDCAAGGRNSQSSVAALLGDKGTVKKQHVSAEDWHNIHSHQLLLWHDS